MNGTVRYGALAATLLVRGYEPIPIIPGEKRPPARGWQKPTEADFLKWQREYANYGVGLLTRGTPACDIDFIDHAIGDEIEALARQMLGDSPLLRIGKAPKRLLVYRADEPFEKYKSYVLLAPDDPADSKGHAVEILADGQQVVAFGIHPDTGKPYHWPGPSPLVMSANELPTITAEMAVAFINAVNALLEARLLSNGWQHRKEQKKPRTNQGGARAAREKCEYSGTTSDPFGPLKSAAMSRLNDWVPDMVFGAFACGDGFRCVATWRGCTNPNVGIHPTGIMDFGGDEGLSPIDLVMKARGVSFIEAAHELAQRLNVPLPEMKQAAAEDEDSAEQVLSLALVRLPVGLTGTRLEKYAAAALRKAADKVVSAPLVTRASVLKVVTWNMSRKFLDVLGPQRIADAMAAAGMAAGIERRDITRAIENGLRTGGVQ